MDLKLDHLRKRYKIEGVSITTVKNSKIHRSYFDGLKSNKEKGSINENTLFQAASISKPITATAVLLLASKKILDLDKDIRTYLKDWDSEEKVTLKQLLSHTGGINVFGFKGYMKKPKIPSISQIIKGEGNTPKIKVVSKVGKFSYSGGGYCLIQKILTNILEDSFPNIINKLIFKPLKMRNSTFEQPLPKKLWKKATSGHSQSGRKITKGWYVYPQMAAAGLWTTSHDLALYLIELQKAYKGKSKIFPQRVIKKMLTPQIKARSGAFGMGMEIVKNQTHFMHKGSNYGFKCKFLGGIKNGKGMVVMTNSDNGYKLIDKVEKNLGF
jgi:CubicO group peptidase (beta-lactamase class C family)